METISSPNHPHGPADPRWIDGEGRCLLCAYSYHTAKIADLEATLETALELIQCEKNNITNLMHYAEGKPGHVPLSGPALQVRDAILEMATRLRKLGNAADVLWEEHKQYSLLEHEVEGCDVHGSDSEGHRMLKSLVEETLAAADRQNDQIHSPQ